MITLYQFEISPFCDKVRRILNVKEQPYSLREVGVLEAGRLKKISPTGKFPVLDHDGRLIRDSTDIAHYLEERFPAPRLIPEDPKGAALVHILEDWADESLYFYEMTMRLAWADNAERWVPELLKYERPVTQRLLRPMAGKLAGRQAKAQGIGRKSRDQILEEVSHHADALSALLQGQDWLVGDELSLADIAVYAQLACIGGTSEGHEIIAQRKSLSEWMARVEKRTDA